MLRVGSPPALILLTALATLTAISIAIYLPAMPALAADLRASASQVQLTVSIFLVGVGLGQLAYGPASDRFGRRPALLFGLAVYGIGSLACALAPSIALLLVGRALQAAGASAGMSLVRAILRDAYPRDRLTGAMSTITGAMAIAPALAPILGSLVLEWFGWRACFALLALFAVVLLAVVWRILPETNQHRDPMALRLAGLAKSYSTLLRHRRYLGFVFAGGLSLAGAFAFTVAAPFILIERLGMTPGGFALLMLVTTAAYVTGTSLAPTMSRRLGMERAIRIGAALCAVAGVGMLLVGLADATAVATVIGVMTVYQLGMGIVLPLGMAGAIGPFPQFAGAASAGIGAAQMLFGALTSAASAAAAPWGTAGVGLVLLVAGGGALAGAWSLARPAPGAG